MDFRRYLKNNGYPQRFINNYGKDEDKKPKEATVNKNCFLI